MRGEIEKKKKKNHGWEGMEVEGKGRVRFNVLKVIPAGSSRGGKKAFTVM